MTNYLALLRAMSEEKHKSLEAEELDAASRFISKHEFTDEKDFLTKLRSAITGSIKVDPADRKLLDNMGRKIF